MAKIEVYSKAWCPYCNKAKALLKSKKLDYQEIDTTHDEALEQEMLERSKRQTVPQIFIDDRSIGGYDDLAGLNATGELDRLLGIDSAKALKDIYDVLIVGAGPAGLSAALYAARKNLKVAIVSMDIGGQMGTTAEIENYPGMNSITGPGLVAQFEEHTDRYQITKLIGEQAVGLTLEGRCRVITTASGKSIHGRTLILASGAEKRKLDIPGEKTLAGKGVVYCATCDGPLFKNKRIAIIGGGNSALEAAIEMQAIASHVTLVSRGKWSGDLILHDKVNASGVEILQGYEPLEIQGEAKVTGLSLRNRDSSETHQLDVDGVFIEVGLAASSEYALDVLETNTRGEIHVDRRLETGLRGVFAAGDVNDGTEKQVIIAAAEGAKAALAAFGYLVHQG
ncbi:MAG: glutaredoxin 3 [Gammaproteobacteria bacterium]|nr:glutaredoxin 3 [Gammaproteobacteria bacterium]